MGLKNYRAGKAFHIYRPKMIDSVGTEVWGELKIDKGKLTVTIPQEFLDNAIYPIGHAAGLRFGDETTGSTGTSLSGDKLHTYGPYSPASNGTITKVTIYTKRTGAPITRYARGILYEDGGDLVTHGAETGITNTSADWIDYNVSNDSIFSATNYNLGLWIESNDFVFIFYYDSGTSNNFIDDNITYHSTNAPPSTFTKDTTYGSKDYSGYATYTAAASGPANLKTMNAITKANIKTINGIAIADVKSINGIA